VEGGFQLLDGMRFVITGGAQGIGSSTARTAASKGAKVIISDIDDVEGKKTVAEIVRDGGIAEYFHCDVTDSMQVKNLMKFAADAYGGVDVLHNNAGVHETMLTRDLAIETMPDEVWDKVIAINLRGPWLCSKYAVPYLKDSSYASIINAGSTASLVAFPSTLAYGPSKAGIAQLTRTLAVELARYRIRVNCYCPGSVRTRMIADYLAASTDPKALLNTLTNTHLIPRLGEPEDIANLVCFLASKEASFINGAVWLIDGGSLAWRGTLDMLGMSPSGN
jgi:NAD(P)-dependent dehydrogenase (short-subunit alcohol dehydrogenase family)